MSSTNNFTETVVTFDAVTGVVREDLGFPGDENPSLVDDKGSEVKDGAKGKKKATPRFRRWCFTLNNYTPEHEEYLKGFGEASYILYGYEKAPKTGTPHLQGYMEFDDKVSMSHIKSELGIQKIALFQCKGNQKQNIAYCMKGGNYVEFGKPKQQGRRRDIESVKADILDGKKKAQDVVLEYGGIQMYSKYKAGLEAAERIAERNKSVFRVAPKTIWLWGPTGVGKSKSVADILEANGTTRIENVYRWAPEEWQDLYEGQKIVWIDEFRGQIKYEQLLSMCDRYYYGIKRRNRPPVAFEAETIYITSSMHPEDVYDDIKWQDSIAQLLRRIEVVYMGPPGTEMSHRGIVERHRNDSRPIGESVSELIRKSRPN